MTLVASSGLNGITKPVSIAVFQEELCEIGTYMTKSVVLLAEHDITPDSSIVIALRLFLVAIALVVSLVITIGFVSSIARAVQL